MPGSKFALAELCGLYWYPVYGFVRYRGHAPHDAQDLTQSFFLYLLEHKALSGVDPLKGKFPGEVDDEIHALCEAIIASEGRLDP
jgi:RNA polymerase sigma-70 factor (ECF subfamily)